MCFAITADFPKAHAQSVLVVGVNPAALVQRHTAAVPCCLDMSGCHTSPASVTARRLMLTQTARSVLLTLTVAHKFAAHYVANPSCRATWNSLLDTLHELAANFTHKWHRLSEEGQAAVQTIEAAFTYAYQCLAIGYHIQWDMLQLHGRVRRCWMAYKKQQ